MTDAFRETLQTTLGAAYTIERELGGGGMSRVFVADDVSLGRKIVVKIIAPDLAEGLSIERFLREVKLAARLQQANIVPVLTAGDATGLPFYTMPFVDGLSLRARLQQGALPIGEAVNILRDIARALSYAHAKGVVHRDIKPENVLLSGGAAVVTDFGIAKALSASRTQEQSSVNATSAGLTRAGMSLGTPAYMSPEQALGDPNTDHRADLYAWGVVAWEMLGGAHPFAGRTTPQALVAAHVSDVPPSVGTRRPDIPSALADVITRCLEKNPERRPASASEVMQALDVVATPTATPQGSRGSSRKWAIAAAVLIVVAGTGAVVARRMQAKPAAATVTQQDAGTKSLAVLPFASVGGDTANAYFAEGIADELTTALARLPGLRLAGRSSAARYKERGAGAQEIGAALKVGAVLDGTVRRAGDRIRVSAELTSTDDGHLIWKESYERELKDVFAVQDDITKAIVGALQMQLAGGGAASSASRGTSNLEAYDLYLRGLQGYRKRGRALVEAERTLTQAIALDPKFARAHAMLATVLAVTPYYLDIQMSDVLPRARAAAERAVALDDGLPEAHMALGHVLTEAFEWKKAESELRRAMALDPNRAEVPFRLGFMLLTSGRVQDAIAPFAQAAAADPFYSMPAVYHGFALALAGRTTEGVAEARRAIELDPTNEAIGNLYTGTLSIAGVNEEAVPYARKMVAKTTNPRRMGFYGWVLGAGGATAEAQAILNKVRAMPPNTWGRYSSLTYLYVAVGDTAHALTMLDSASRRGGDLLLAQAISSPRFDALRGSPRFAEAMRRYNLDLSRVTAPDGGRSR